MKKRILRKRIFRGLTLAFAIAVAIPVASAAARPMGDSPVVYGGGKVVQSRGVQSSAPIVSEKVAGMFSNSVGNPYHLRKLHVYSSVSQSPSVSQKLEEIGLPSQLSAANSSATSSVVREKLAEIGLPTQSATVASTASSSPVVSEKTAGLGLPSQPEDVVSTSSPGFDWSDAGIGAGATTALIVAMLGGTLLFVRRRHHGTFAH